MALADVLVVAGRAGEAAQIAQRAVEVFESKGNVVCAGRAAEVARTAEAGPADELHASRIDNGDPAQKQYSPAAEGVESVRKP
jgi:hypothetical protein